MKKQFLFCILLFVILTISTFYLETEASSWTFTDTQIFNASKRTGSLELDFTNRYNFYRNNATFFDAYFKYERFSDFEIYYESDSGDIDTLTTDLNRAYANLFFSLPAPYNPWYPNFNITFGMAGYYYGLTSSYRLYGGLVQDFELADYETANDNVGLQFFDDIYFLDFDIYWFEAMFGLVNNKTAISEKGKVNWFDATNDFRFYFEFNAFGVGVFNLRMSSDEQASIETELPPTEEPQKLESISFALNFTDTINLFVEIPNVIPGLTVGYDLSITKEDIVTQFYKTTKINELTIKLEEDIKFTTDLTNSLSLPNAKWMIGADLYFDVDFTNNYLRASYFTFKFGLTGEAIKKNPDNYLSGGSFGEYMSASMSNLWDFTFGIGGSYYHDDGFYAYGKDTADVFGFTTYLNIIIYAFGLHASYSLNHSDYLMNMLEFVDHSYFSVEVYFTI